MLNSGSPSKKCGECDDSICTAWIAYGHLDFGAGNRRGGGQGKSEENGGDKFSGHRLRSPS